MPIAIYYNIEYTSYYYNRLLLVGLIHRTQNNL